MKSYQPHILFNDILNTTKKYIQQFKKLGIFVINFEDLGNGTDYADLIFNPIYEFENSTSRKFFGSDYACVRDEFRILNPKPLRKKAERALITFGGTDPHNLTLPVLQFLHNSKVKNLEFVLVLGLGFKRKTKIIKLTNQMKKDGFLIQIIEDSILMAKIIRDSDFVITSNGRTVFEIASLLVPMISISVTKTEELHEFSKISGGSIHLGAKSDLTSQKLKNAINKMLDFKFRKKLRQNLARYNLLHGIEEIVNIINTKYKIQIQ